MFNCVASLKYLVLHKCDLCWITYSLLTCKLRTFHWKTARRFSNSLPSSNAKGFSSACLDKSVNSILVRGTTSLLRIPDTPEVQRSRWSHKKIKVTWRSTELSDLLNQINPKATASATHQRTLLLHTRKKTRITRKKHQNQIQMKSNR